jgi:hypothetical protein
LIGKQSQLELRQRQLSQFKKSSNSSDSVFDAGTMNSFRLLSDRFDLANETSPGGLAIRSVIAEGKVRTYGIRPSLITLVRRTTRKVIASAQTSANWRKIHDIFWLQCDLPNY